MRVGPAVRLYRFIFASLILLCMSSACAHQPEFPVWFDAFHRVPVRSVLVHGYRMAYLDTGGSGPPVVLLHGFGGSMWQWEYQHDALGQDHRVLIVDLIGAGHSDKPDIAYAPDEMIGLLCEFLDQVQVDRASFVGNSMGAGLAIGMALTHPDRVDRLILIAGLPDHVRDRLTNRLIKGLIDTPLPAWVLRAASWFTGRGTTARMLRQFVHDRTLITPSVIDRSYRNRKDWNIIPPLLAIARGVPLWEAGFATRLGEIRHPTLILWGDHDEVFPPDVGKRVQETISHARLVIIPDAGHIPQWERPQIVNPLLLQFLAP
jgi:pimeloyl-ACP methyl ester carboxylesterase